MPATRTAGAACGVLPHAHDAREQVTVGRLRHAPRGTQALRLGGAGRQCDAAALAHGAHAGAVEQGQRLPWPALVPQQAGLGGHVRWQHRGQFHRLFNHRGRSAGLAPAAATQPGQPHPRGQQQHQQQDAQEAPQAPFGQPRQPGNAVLACLALALVAAVALQLLVFLLRLLGLLDRLPVRDLAGRVLQRVFIGAVHRLAEPGGVHWRAAEDGGRGVGGVCRRRR
ncbi:hypothetical protein G6F35_014746 [Rhizopus arrhizus]|nr:hypothetical protein G6F35_014746 [Rhizopus arrhizus]